MTAAATALAHGAFVVHAFANVYAFTTRGDAPSVRAANLFKGRPTAQVGSVTTAPARLSGLFDLGRLGGGLRAADVLGLIDEFLCLGPVGFRGPAAEHLPDHLTVRDAAGDRWVQAIVPGYRCPSNAFLAQCLHLCGTDHLHITSANPSHHATGAPEEPAHYRAAEIRAAFADEPRLVVLEHADEEAALRAYPRHAPMSVTVLGIGTHQAGTSRPTVVLERLGSLPLDEVRAVTRRLGIDLKVAPGGRRRQQQRHY
ncbi:hypothetical protein [Georgenia subflava]|uniref:YrdC-like domain-containing protein n=1 Tax=Georgenia subflava TaxID=1622177 RepID=A0A6N7EGU3_9MICO|nr:hypothetical protein [Georgenia subflava]MPV37260.1 hypothetical protein [Georgenia subflava]